MAATDLKFVDPSNTIEFQRQKINEIAADIHSAFTGTASLNVGRIQIAGADIALFLIRLIKLYSSILVDLQQIEQYSLLVSLQKYSRT